MGLDTTHDCWHGSYRAFNRWRSKLAEVANIPLDLMQGHYANDNMGAGLGYIAEQIATTDKGYLLRQLKSFDALLPIQWAMLKDDSLHTLLHHSDCDGYLAVDTLCPLADRLESLLPLLDGDGQIGSYREKTQQFIDGLRSAYELGESVLFL